MHYNIFIVVAQSINQKGSRMVSRKEKKEEKHKILNLVSCFCYFDKTHGFHRITRTKQSKTFQSTCRLQYYPRSFLNVNSLPRWVDLIKVWRLRIVGTTWIVNDDGTRTGREAEGCSECKSVARVTRDVDLARCFGNWERPLNSHAALSLFARREIRSISEICRVWSEGAGRRMCRRIDYFTGWRCTRGCCSADHCWLNDGKRKLWFEWRFLLIESAAIRIVDTSEFTPTRGQ